jgi:hypothetical protein
MKIGDYLRNIHSSTLYQYLGNNKFVEIDINFIAHAPFDQSLYQVNHFIRQIPPRMHENFEPVKLLIIRE